MKLLLLISTCNLGIILSGFHDHSITVYLTGRLERSFPTDTLMSISHIPIFVAEKGKALAKDVSNEKGVFHLQWNDDNKKPYKPFYFYAILKTDTFLLATVKTFESDTPDLTFTLPTYVQVMLQTKVN